MPCPMLSLSIAVAGECDIDLSRLAGGIASLIVSDRVTGLECIESGGACNVSLPIVTMDSMRE